MHILQDTLKSFSTWMEREQIIRYNDQQQRKSEENYPKNQLKCVKTKTTKYVTVSNCVYVPLEIPIVGFGQIG